MNPFRYFLGRALQIVGLGVMTIVMLKFFSDEGMEPLLWGSLGGATFFYGGTLILGKSET